MSWGTFSSSINANQDTLHHHTSGGPDCCRRKPSPKRALKSFLWNLRRGLAIAYGISWQLKKHCPELHATVLVLGTLEEGCKRRGEERTSGGNSKQDLRKTMHYSERKLCRICEDCLNGQMQNGDPIAMSWFGAKNVKYTSPEMLRYVIATRRVWRLVSWRLVRRMDKEDDS